MRRTTIALTAFVLILIFLTAWAEFRYVMLAVRTAFAEEQTEIFDEMVAKTSVSLDKSPPEVAGAIRFLQYARDYYPSGTKQVSGSHLDLIVERARETAFKQIIQMLRDASGKDCGESPDAWIEAYQAAHGSQLLAMAGSAWWNALTLAECVSILRGPFG
ncbi:MAG: hypothetical protein WD468_07305 [Pirellulales bacterium]